MSAEPSEPDKPRDFADGFRETVLASFPSEVAQSVRDAGETILKEHADCARPPHPTQALEAIGRELQFLERYLDEVALALDTTAEDLEPSASSAALARRLAICTRIRARRLEEMAVDLEYDLLLLRE